MIKVTKVLLFSLFFQATVINVARVSAFASPVTRNSNSMSTVTTLRRREPGTAIHLAGPPNVAVAPAPLKKERIAAFDSIRVFLAISIVLGHFISFADPSPFWLRFFSQHNCVVGAFFALSGYVTAYTSTELAERKASPKLVGTPAPKWIMSKVFGYYPMHIFVMLLFSPMFLWVDVHYNGLKTGLMNGLLCGTLLQSWFPMHAEVWNAPTWYLSAYTFITALFPFAIPPIAKMSKKDLRRTAGWLFLISLLPKLGYCYDFGAWSLAEGLTSAKAHPNIAAFNLLRFNPLNLASEVLLGAVACRLVMLDKADGEDPPVKTNALSTFAPLALILALMSIRAANLVQVSDLLFRTIVFVPLFLRLLMSSHRNTIAKVKDPVVSFLSNKFLVDLGALTFPIYIVHGPIGQMFFKKIVANKLFGKVLKGQGYFGLYLCVTTGAAFALQKMFQSKKIGEWSKAGASKIASFA